MFFILYDIFYLILSDILSDIQNGKQPSIKFNLSIKEYHIQVQMCLHNISACVSELGCHNRMY